LKDGDYILRVTGISGTANPEPIGDYLFRVTRN